MRRPVLAVACLAALAPARARADAIDDIGKKLVSYDAEVRKLGEGLKRPAELGFRGADYVQRRVIDAQVAFGMGSYDDAALLLFDVVEKHRDSRDWDVAVYYLAESLFQRADYAASRSYFIKLIDEVGDPSAYYQQGLERLIELSIKLQDATGVADFLAALDKIPAGKLRDSVPYVKGRYAYFSGDFDGALGNFGAVKPGTEYYFQARYFMGATQVAKGDLGAASGEYQKLTREQAKTDTDKQVLELAHIALGRLYYERDQPGKAVDHYLMVPRKSELFDEALYEVAWVYVKDKQFDKALRALELLALTDPRSAKLPDVRILEGNLRIRKAQSSPDLDTTAAEEQYSKALDAFESTRDSYQKPRDELERILAEHADPVAFLDQITGLRAATFDIKAELPEVAAAWLREEPDVKRVVVVETDLGTIKSDLDSSQETLERIERALDSPSRVNIFPALAERQSRATEILEDLFKMRATLGTQEQALVNKVATAEERSEFERLQGRRQAIAGELASLPHANVAYGERIKKAKEDYDLLEQRAQEAQVLIDSTEAEVVAIEKYLSDTSESGGETLTKENYGGALAELRAEIASMREELAAIRKELVLARDLAGLGDETAKRAESLRAELRQALDDESQFMSAMIQRMSGGDRTKAEQIASLTTRANQILLSLDRINMSVAQIVDSALVDVRAAVVEEKANLAAYRQEYESTSAESRGLGGEVVGLAFTTVSKKFYDVLIRADVGIIDVAWAGKEEAEQNAKRVNLDEAREQRMIDEEFRDVLGEPKEKQKEEEEEAPPADGDGAGETTPPPIGGEGEKPAEGGQP